jgi:hypothetical protein
MTAENWGIWGEKVLAVNLLGMALEDLISGLRIE